MFKYIIFLYFLNVLFLLLSSIYFTFYFTFLLITRLNSTNFIIAESTFTIYTVSLT